MAQQNSLKKHSIQIDGREKLTATGIDRVDFFSDELIAAHTADGRLNIKGEGLYIESLDSETGDMLVKGRIIAMSYTDGVKPSTLLGRLLK